MKENHSKRKHEDDDVEKGKEHVWQPELEEIILRQRFADALGGENNIERQHQSGRMTARERINQLLDDGSFHEIGAFTGQGQYDENGDLENVKPANIIIGKGMIAKRRVVVAAEDFTVRAGSSEAAAPEKMVFAERLAVDTRIPLIRLVDAVGGSIRLLEKNQSTKIPGYDQWPMTDMLGIIPIVGVAMGPCAGLGAVRVIASHFSIMIKNTSQIFAAGPHIVGPGMNQEITKEELGGSQIHAHGSGVADNEAENEIDALGQVKQFLSYMPSNVFQLPPTIDSQDNADRKEESLASIIPRDRRKVYNMREILIKVFDRNSLFEIGKYQGRSTITMLGRLKGYPVGIMANDPYIYGGAMTDVAAEKIVRFVDMCDTFHLPVVNFVDQPGVAIGLDAERRGTIRKAIRAQFAIAQASVPWATVFVRRSFGVAGAAYAPRNRTNLRCAWPSAYWGSLPIEGGVEAAYRKEIAAAEDPKALRNELVKYYRRFESPFRTAERFGIEEIIDPRNTRPVLCDWAEEAFDLLPERLGIIRRSMRI